jgi:type IV pilus biogenesis protein PilP
VLAVRATITPAPRPENFESVVSTARRTPAAALSAPAAPTLPTSASVARQATVENAIRLNRINLIGVYGSASNRRALVRLANGRYVKVEVGDRLDGGQVAAIGRDALRYVKRGRNIVLELPEGG